MVLVKNGFSVSSLLGFMHGFSRFMHGFSAFMHGFRHFMNSFPFICTVFTAYAQLYTLMHSFSPLCTAFHLYGSLSLLSAASHSRTASHPSITSPSRRHFFLFCSLPSVLTSIQNPKTPPILTKKDIPFYEGMSSSYSSGERSLAKDSNTFL